MATFVTQTMDVTVHVPAVLREYCGGQSTLAIRAPDVAASLAELRRMHPSLYVCICDETGAVRRHVNIFVNTAHMRDLDGMETSLARGDVITILPSVSGG